MARRLLAGICFTCIVSAVVACGAAGTRTSIVPAASPPQAEGVSRAADMPVADHHKHLISPAAAALMSEEPLAEVELPPDLAGLLRERAERWNDAERLAELFAENSIALDIDGPVWTQGRSAVSEYMAGLFGRAHRVKPVAYERTGSSAYIAGYYVRDTEQGLRHFGNVLMTLRQDSAGAWRILAELPAFPGPPVPQPLTAEQLIEELDAAGTRKAVVMSVAYWYGSGWRATAVEDEYEKVRAENDWVAEQVARHPARLVAFCSFNPIREYALAELDRCAESRRFRGLKLHFGNSRVDVRDTAHVERLRAVFRSANRHGLPIAVHLWTGPEYETEGREHADIVLGQLLPEAPDVVIQIAHMAGGGRSTDTALAVFAEAIASNDPRTRHLYFDVATLVEGQSDEGLEGDAMRIRQMGLERVLWGSDTAPPNPPARQGWLMFRARLPLTDEELRNIATNQAPYLR